MYRDEEKIGGKTIDQLNMDYYLEIGDYDKISEIVSKSSVKKKKPYQKKDYTGKNFEQRLPKMVITNKKYLKTFKGPRTVYDFLWCNIVRGRMVNDKLNIKRKYYDKGILACSFPLRVIAEKCLVSIHTVERYINVLKKSGFIKIEKVKIDDHRTQNVYMLGTWHYVDGVEKEYLYLQDECEN